MPKVFISHSIKDRNFLEQKLVPLLSEHGIDTWYCELNIDSASDWEMSIRNGLKSCDWFLLVMSSHAHESEWVRSEVNWALDNRKGKVVPLLIDDCDPSEINLRLTILQYIDFRAHSEQQIANLLATWGMDYREHRIDHISIFPAVLGPINLSFEGPLVDGFPQGWFNSVFYVSGVSPKYEVTVMPREDGNGNCVKMQYEKAGPKEFGSLMQRCVGNYLGQKTIRLKGEIRTNEVARWAGMWLRADGESSHLFFYNMSDRPITGTTDWQEYIIEAELPKGVKWLNYGILLLARGEIYASKFNLSYKDKNLWIPMSRWCHHIPIGVCNSQWWQNAD